MKKDKEIKHVNIFNNISRNLLDNLSIDEFLIDLKKDFERFNELKMLQNKSNLKDFVNEIDTAIYDNFKKHITPKYIIYMNKIYYPNKGWLSQDMQLDFKAIARKLYVEEISYLCPKVSSEPRIKLLTELFNEGEIYEKDQGIIQFNNCFIENGVLNEGYYKKGIPSFIIRRNIDLNNKNMKLDEIPTFNKLILNLSNFDKEIAEIIINSLSIGLIPSPTIKTSFSKALVLWGDSGTGKSTLLTTLSKVVGGINISPMSTKEISERTKNAIASTLYTYVDEPEKFVKSEITEIMKVAMTNGQVEIRKLYKEATQTHVLSTMLITTNKRLQFDDSTGSIDRRLLVVETQSILNEDYDFFINLHKDETLDQIATLLVHTSLRLQNNKLIAKIADEASLKLQNEIEDFLSDTSPMTNFIKDFTPDELDGHSVVYVQYLYKQWCEGQSINKMGITKFNEFMERQAKMVRTRTKGHLLDVDDIEAYEIVGATIPKRPIIWRKRST